MSSKKKFLVLSALFSCSALFNAKAETVFLKNTSSDTYTDFQYRIPLTQQHPAYLKVIYSSEGETDYLYYCYEQANGECNATPSNIAIWVKIPQLGANSQATILIKDSLDNSYVVNGDKIFDFYDDFNDNDWQANWEKDDRNGGPFDPRIGENDGFLELYNEWGLCCDGGCYYNHIDETAKTLSLPFIVDFKFKQVNLGDQCATTGPAVIFAHNQAQVIFTGPDGGLNIRIGSNVNKVADNGLPPDTNEHEAHILFQSSGVTVWTDYLSGNYTYNQAIGATSGPIGLAGDTDYPHVFSTQYIDYINWIRVRKYIPGVESVIPKVLFADESGNVYYYNAANGKLVSLSKTEDQLTDTDFNQYGASLPIENFDSVLKNSGLSSVKVLLPKNLADYLQVEVQSPLAVSTNELTSDQFYNTLSSNITVVRNFAAFNFVNYDVEGLLNNTYVLENVGYNPFFNNEWLYPYSAGTFNATIVNANNTFIGEKWGVYNLHMLTTYRITTITFQKGTVISNNNTSAGSVEDIINFAKSLNSTD